MATGTVSNLRHLKQHIEIFACPKCRGNLIYQNAITCAACGSVYNVQDGIPLLYAPNHRSGREDVTDAVKAFYEDAPFPNYESLETASDLAEKAERSHFASSLNRQIPFGATILEVGCGTGQMSNYLGIANRFVFGADICFHSLKLATEFKDRNNLERTGFYQMNLFRPIFKEQSFHLVICNGVLHHTSDPFGGFQSIARLVKKNGYILVGLYNTYGRFVTDMRRFIFNISRDRLKFLDPRLADASVGDVRKMTWFRDQYKHPHESKHTIGEVLHWFDTIGFTFVYGIPNPKAFESFNPDDRMFELHPQGNMMDHFIVQAGYAFTGGREGGLFMLIGKKK